jgi:excisionase family DNA binding protein
MDGERGAVGYKEAARYLGISVRTLFARMKAGLIESYAEGSRRLFPVRGLNAYIAVKVEQARQHMELSNGKHIA